MCPPGALAGCLAWKRKWPPLPIQQSGGREGRHRLWGTHSWTETVPINQRLVHLAMPRGTPLCAEGESSTETKTGTVAKASPSLLLGALLPCSNDSVGRARHGQKESPV